MEKEDLMAIIQIKSKEILQHVVEPEQKEAYFVWQIMELLCDRNRLRDVVCYLTV